MAESAGGQPILDRVRAALHSDRRLGPRWQAERLEIDAEGALTIEGEVPDLAAKKRALIAVAALPGVSAIVDRLHVRPAAPMGDAEIRSRLRRLFAAEPALEGLAIRQLHHDQFSPTFEPVYEAVRGDPAKAPGHLDIEVRQGVVTLNGSVPGLNSKRLAGVMAWWVPGVRDVVNGLAVEPDEEDAPIRIEEAVRTALERNPYIDAGQIRVGVRGRTVRLTGALRTDALSAAAERDAWSVFGVDDVINEIAILP